MKLACYRSTRPGLQGVANRLIRWRLRGPYSHNELVFEPGDNVDKFMPDGTCAADARGALWCASSVAAERLPPWSKRRAGRYGGVRFKRIALDRSRWDLVDCPADPAQICARAVQAEGAAYDWRLILGYVAWLVPGQSARWTCNEFCAWCVGLADPWRFDCNALAAAVALAAQTTHERKHAS